MYQTPKNEMLPYPKITITSSTNFIYIFGSLRSLLSSSSFTMRPYFSHPLLLAEVVNQNCMEAAAVLGRDGCDLSSMISIVPIGM